MYNQPEFLNQLISITQDAGQLLLQKFETNIHVGLKGREEIVTEADRASESMLHERLLDLLPGSGFCGEETGYHPGEKGLIWVVDPLDGTHNYSEGIPIWACSVALLDENRLPLIGVLDLPTMNKTYWGRRGQGSFVNGERLAVDTSPLSETSLIGVQSRIRIDPFPSHMERTCRRHCGRSLGAVAYHGALLAHGKMRACVDLTVKLHDIAAIMVLIEEAGGIVSNLDGESVFPEEYFTGTFENWTLPFFAGDPLTGPEVREYLFPEGTPEGVLAAPIAQH